MITSKNIKIKKIDNLTSEYIENELAHKGFDVLRWAITNYDEEYFYINAAIVEND